MFSPAALILIPAGMLFLWPLLARGRDVDSSLQVGLTAISLSVGVLAFGMMVLGLLPGQWLTPLNTLIIVVVGWGIGLTINSGWVNVRGWRTYWVAQWDRLKRLNTVSLMMWVVIGSLFIITIYLLYFPFVGEDTLARYGLQAKQIYLAGHIPDELWGYPPLVPLSFLASWFAAGGVNEHLAKAISLISAVGTLGATFLLAWRVFPKSQVMPYLAAALIAMTPLFIRNASLEYTDVPTSFPMMLSLVWMIDWWRRGRSADAWLAGALMGVAIFTKQSALTGLASLAAIPILWLITTRQQSVKGRWQRVGAALPGIVIPSLMIAAPWYVRNAILTNGREIIPIAGLYHTLEPNIGLIGLIPSLNFRNDFGLALFVVYGIGWIVGLGLAGWQIYLSLTGRMDRPPNHALLAAMAVPYWLAWWTNFSFDARFLVIILPIMGIWVCSALAYAGRSVKAKLPVPNVPLVYRGALAILLLGLLFLGGRDRMGALYYALTRPFATEDERIRQIKGEMYDLVQYIRDNIDADSINIMSMDGRLLYYLPEYEIQVVYPIYLEDLSEVDYLVHSSSIYSIYNSRLGWDQSEFYLHAFDPVYFEPVYESEGVHIMRVLHDATLNPEMP